MQQWIKQPSAGYWTNDSACCFPLRKAVSDWLRLSLPLPVGLADLDPCLGTSEREREKEQDATQQQEASS